MANKGDFDHIVGVAARKLKQVGSPSLCHSVDLIEIYQQSFIYNNQSVNMDAIV